MYQPVPAEPLLSAKLSIPPVPPGHCVRQRLFETLTAGSRVPVTTVLGSAGSGKTTLAAGWARSGAATGPVAWLTLDERDDEPGVFWSYVLHALRRGVPGLDPGIMAPAHRGGVNRSTLTCLATSLADRASPTSPASGAPPVVLVLDRAEAITDRSIAADLELLVRYSAPGLRLVVVGRSARLVPLERYRLAGELTEIGPDQLALTPGETAELLRTHAVQLPDGDAALHHYAEGLHHYAEGWMTGVCLSALALRPGDRVLAGHPGPAGHQAVAQFLRTEVFEAQPARIRDLLLRTSILDEVDPGLADRLTGRSDARGVLDKLVRANAFVEPLDDTRFRCRRLFREILVEDLYARHPQLVRRLHGSAARWYTEQRRYREALGHAVAIDDWDYAATLAVTRLGVAWLLTAPEAGPLCTILAGLPDDQPGTAAALLRAVLALARFDAPAARTAVDDAEKAATQGGAEDTDALYDGIRTAGVLLGRLSGDVELAESAAADLAGRWRGAQPDESGAQARTRTVVLANLGAAQSWAGRYEAARATLGQAAGATEPGTEYGVHDALAQLALLEVHKGRLRRADRYARQSLAMADRAGLHPGARIGAADAALAAVALYRNDPPTVHEHLTRVVVATRSRHDPLTATTTAMLRVRVAQGRHDGRRALAAAEAARADLSRWSGTTDVRDLVEAAALQAHLALGETTLARECLESMSDGATRTLALGHLHAAEGRPEDASRVLAVLTPGRDAPPVTRLSAALARGRIAFASGDLPAAGRGLQEALDLGRPEGVRLPFVESGAWVRRLLRQLPDLAAQHDWLFPQPRPEPSAGPAPVVEPLTPREVDVLRRLSEALSTEDIAAALYLSVNTVKTHLKNIYRKLGTSGRSATARRARELHLLEPPTPDRAR